MIKYIWQSNKKKLLTLSLASLSGGIGFNHANATISVSPDICYKASSNYNDGFGNLNVCPYIAGSLNNGADGQTITRRSVSTIDMVEGALDRDTVTTFGINEYEFELLTHGNPLVFLIASFEKSLAPSYESFIASGVTSTVGDLIYYFNHPSENLDSSMYFALMDNAWGDIWKSFPTDSRWINGFNDEHYSWANSRGAVEVSPSYLQEFAEGKQNENKSFIAISSNQELQYVTAVEYVRVANNTIVTHVPSPTNINTSNLEISETQNNCDFYSFGYIGGFEACDVQINGTFTMKIPDDAFKSSAGVDYLNNDQVKITSLNVSVMVKGNDTLYKKNVPVTFAQGTDKHTITVTLNVDGGLGKLGYMMIYPSFSDSYKLEVNYTASIPLPSHDQLKYAYTKNSSWTKSNWWPNKKYLDGLPSSINITSALAVTS
ncbi:hypothetical protein [Cysteiniphilum sp. QT6929]|uniref:hypothetical protein n=1 Tax=Cysteiniphilum sp. QT6929 TaxID=2975055 RepID=UPI0024B3C463|nr:hypothetical protein [Cysteiniphilum sp. QT6929]WHN65099.1 hypothetical protein NYP54_08615 [Cysteiniphilum sp. QT6929]